ncbi:hypothetical protein HNQ36_005130 [Afipia massiliensis]|uniref:Uncharacterized protein n=1 Tax=Afipia massiliensis TaxID=211460 RepID=A0A840N3W9_9BRAD|nr:hypothetical protein [Afipia massiliensis]MBB5055119.1 hypothetical protein [Afipia massiliensis]
MMVDVLIALKLEDASSHFVVCRWLMLGFAFAELGQSAEKRKFRRHTRTTPYVVRTAGFPKGARGRLNAALSMSAVAKPST